MYFRKLQKLNNLIFWFVHVVNFRVTALNRWTISGVSIFFGFLFSITLLLELVGFKPIINSQYVIFLASSFFEEPKLFYLRRFILWCVGTYKPEIMKTFVSWDISPNSGLSFPANDALKKVISWWQNRKHFKLAKHHLQTSALRRQWKLQHFQLEGC